MNHQLVLTDIDFNGLKNIIITKDEGFYQIGDTVTITKGRSRDQKIMSIAEIHNGDHVHKGWCILGLTSSTKAVYSEHGNTPLVEDKDDTAVTISKEFIAKNPTDLAAVHDAMSGKHEGEPQY